MFSRGIDKQHRAVMDYISWNQVYEDYFHLSEKGRVTIVKDKWKKSNFHFELEVKLDIFQLSISNLKVEKKSLTFEQVIRSEI